MCGDPCMKCGGLCSAEHVRILLYPPLLFGVLMFQLSLADMPNHLTEFNYQGGKPGPPGPPVSWPILNLNCFNLIQITYQLHTSRRKFGRDRFSLDHGFICLLWFILLRCKQEFRSSEWTSFIFILLFAVSCYVLPSFIGTLITTLLKSEWIPCILLCAGSERFSWISRFSCEWSTVFVIDFRYYFRIESAESAEKMSHTWSSVALYKYIIRQRFIRSNICIDSFIKETDRWCRKCSFWTDEIHANPY